MFSDELRARVEEVLAEPTQDLEAEAQVLAQAHQLVHEALTKE
ncbi:MAG: hypothetical protein Q4A92_06115 [Corynebacterium sp.]|nr:hypothetical protein [Corynebacterium sp.]